MVHHTLQTNQRHREEEAQNKQTQIEMYRPCDFKVGWYFGALKRQFFSELNRQAFGQLKLQEDGSFNMYP